MLNRNLNDKTNIEKKDNKYKLQRKKSCLQEDNLSINLLGKRVIGSGCIDFFKGDVETDTFLWEVKYTKKEYFILLYIWIKKIDIESSLLCKNFGLYFSIYNRNINNNNWIIVNKKTLTNIISYDIIDFKQDVDSIKFSYKFLNNINTINLFRIREYELFLLSLDIFLKVK